MAAAAAAAAAAAGATVNHLPAHAAAHPEAQMAGLPPGHLPQLATAHPEAFIALIDCSLRCPVLLAVDALSQPDLLTHTFGAVLHSEIGGNTAAVAGLASACASLAKRTVQFTKASDGLQAQAAAAEPQDRSDVAAACFLAAVPVLVGEYLRGFASARRPTKQRVLLTVQAMAA
jgi:hypothetical protein